MASAILVGKKRYAATDIQREKLQLQITAYAVRHHAAQAARESQEANKRLAEIEKPEATASMDGFIERTMAIVEALVHRACRSCNRADGAHEVSCTELAAS